MENLFKVIKNYKNAIFIVLACVAVTIAGSFFSKGDFYKYNYERQTLKDCQMGWYEQNDKICENYKEKQRAIDENDTSATAIQIPQKVPFDYIISLASILQVLFVALASFILGGEYKSEKFTKTWKYIPKFVLIAAVCVVLNFLLTIVNGEVSSNDMLRFLFEIVVSLIMLVIGRKLK